MTRHDPARRRILQIIAATPLALAATGARPAGHRPLVWRGTALGAAARIELYADGLSDGQALLASCAAEIRRLEAIFSLYREDSAISRLNRQGWLEAPPAPLLHLLTRARGFSELTAGAFDVTVQPLWDLYSDHFRRPGADPDGPSPRALARTLALVGYRGLVLNRDHLRLRLPGMAITCNGIAQGYITDHVADRLRAAGMSRVLIDLGEVRALGTHPDGRPWQVGLADPTRPQQLIRRLALVDGAVASSAGAATVFDRGGRHHHLWDPRDGHSSRRYAGVSVQAADATTADALSTGFSSMPAAEIGALLGRLPGTRAWLVSEDRSVLELPG